MVPVMLNCWDWARIFTPVGFCWTKLIWKPWPVGQPLEGASTEVESLDVVTFCFRTTLTFGVDCCSTQTERTMSKREHQFEKKPRGRTMFIKDIVKLEGSVATELQVMLWDLVLASQVVS